MEDMGSEQKYMYLEAKHFDQIDRKFWAEYGGIPE